MCLWTVNVALNKPAYQQYSYIPGDDRYDATNAVNGRRSNLSWDGGQCAVSEYGRRTATWWVNLTSIHEIHQITIYFLTNNNGKVTVIVYLANACHWFFFSKMCITYGETQTPTIHIFALSVKEKCKKKKSNCFSECNEYSY